MTKNQKQLFDFICEYIGEKGYAPSFEEMARGLNLKSKSGIARMLKRLHERGKIDYVPFRARAIELKKEVEPHTEIWAFLANKGLAAEFANYLEGK